MAQELQPTTTPALPVVDTAEPDTILSLPPWLVTQIAAVSDLGYGRTILDPESKVILGQIATIPKSKMPTGPQRQAIAQRIEQLHAASMPGPLESTLKIIGSIVKRNRAASQDEDLADIEIDAYRDALEDLPAWAVREALRRWRRGDVSGDRRDLNFAPKEHRLRSIALMIESSVRGQIIRLQRVLDAEELVELSAEQRKSVVEQGISATPEMGSKAEPAGDAEAERTAAERNLNRIAEETRAREADGASKGAEAHQDSEAAA